MVPFGVMCFGGRFHAGGKGELGKVSRFARGAVVADGKTALVVRA